MKIKETYHKYKELKKNPRKRALLQLGLWILFFVVAYFVIILIPRPKPSNYHRDSNQNEEYHYETMQSYEYEMLFQYNHQSEKITGTYFDDQYYFSYLDEEYYASSDGIFLVDSKNKQMKENESKIVSLSMVELSKETISLWMEMAQLLEQKEYKDGLVLMKYSYEIDENHQIPFTVTKEDGKITKVDVDLQSYLASKNELYDSFEVTISYSEINNIRSYQKDYSDYTWIGGNTNADNEN